MAPNTTHGIEGYVKRGFEGVREAFVENFERRGELGAACCAYVGGEPVVDLWGGIRDKPSGAAWKRDTMVVVYSATKGLAAMTLAVAHSRGWLDYDERVSTYWPEFAQNGKAAITVRQLLAHQAGLFVLDEPIGRGLVADLDRLAVVLARQTPAWEPGTRQGYHGITLGFYESELLRRLDPHHRSIGRFFQDEIATPLGLDVYIRLPGEIPDARLATIARPSLAELFRGFPLRLALDTLNPRSKITLTLRGSQLPHDDQRVYARNLEIPSGGAVGTARAIARAYGVFATGGRELGLAAETLKLLSAPAVAPARGFYDECLKSDGAAFSLGFMKCAPAVPFGGASSYGSPGAGGSMGFADPEAGVGYAYVMNRMGTRLNGDPRDVALRDALYAAIPAQAFAAEPPFAERVREFLAQNRIAVAGVSHDTSRHPVGNLIYRRLKDTGHEVFAVNPNMGTFDGEPCYPSLRFIPGGVDGVVIVTRPETTDEIVHDCVEAGVPRVWMHQSIGKGTSVSRAAVDYCREHHMSVIDGGCPMMFGPGVDFGHACMRTVLKATRRLPA